jgi:hypothetical protein
MKDKLQELFIMLEDEFPYSSMGTKFRGAHHIQRNRESNSALTLGIWWNGKAYDIYINDGELDDLQKFVGNLKTEIKN